jgi:hypothetical protein
MLLRKSVVAFISMICLLQLCAQAPKHTPRFSPVIDDNINGFWEYLPRNYSVDVSKRYPLLIFIHGSGEQGQVQDMPTINLVLKNGPPRNISNGTFPDSFYVAGNWYKFIVISPQIKIGLYGSSSIITPATVQSVISYAKSAYRIDTTRIYLSGLSMGGGATWDYAGSNIFAANSLAGIVVACGAGDVSPEEAYSIGQSNLPILATHNFDDPLVAASRTQANMANILSSNPNMGSQPRAIYWSAGGHNVWRRTFENINAGSTPGGNVTDTLGINMYQWMLQFNRLQLALPVSWQSFSIQQKNETVLLVWILSNQDAVRHYEVERSKNSRDWQVISIIQARPEKQNVRYTCIDNHPEAGKSFYRIRAVDVNGTESLSAIKEFTIGNSNGSVRVFPNPFLEQVLLNVPMVDEQRITVHVTDVTGKLVANKQIFLTNHYAVLNGLGQLPSGTYTINIVSNGRQLYRQQLLKD